MFMKRIQMTNIKVLFIMYHNCRRNFLAPKSINYFCLKKVTKHENRGLLNVVVNHLEY